MKYIIAKKREMTQVFKDDGTVVPVTVLEAGPCVVTQLKTKEKDGYMAVQLGFGSERHLTKSLQGHLKTAGKTPKTIREFLVETIEGRNVGDMVMVTTFAPGEFVEVEGVSKGKGFQGVVKRHHFRGGPASHGHKDNLRMPGSIGSGGIQRVFKGVKMGGRMGTDQVTIKNLEVIAVDEAKNLLMVKGAVPGAPGGIVLVMGGYPNRQHWK